MNLSKKESFMKKLIMFSFLAIFISCSTQEDPVDPTPPPPPIVDDATFITNVQGTHTVLGVDYIANADGDLLVEDVVTYWFFGTSSATEAYYSTTEVLTDYLGVAIPTLDDGTKKLQLFKKDRIEFWADFPDVRFTVNHDISTAAEDSFVINHKAKTITIDDTAYTMSATTGHLENSGNVVYQYAGQKNEHQAYYREATSKKYLGVAFSGGTDLQIYKKDRVDFWTTPNDVLFTLDHLVGFIDPTWAETWTKHSDMPGPKGGVVLLQHGNTILVGGGEHTWGDNNETKDFYKSTDAGGTWTEFTAVMDSITVGDTALGTGIGIGNNDRGVVLDANNYIIVKFGTYKNNSGDTTTVSAPGQIIRSTDGGLNWEKVSDLEETKYRSGSGVTRVLTSANGVAAGLYVIGQSSPADSTTITTYVLYSADGTTWTEQTATAGVTTALEDYSLVANGSTLYLMGGGSPNGTGHTTVKNELWKSADGGLNWEEVTTLNMWEPRERFHTVAVDDQIFVLGGLGANGGNDVWVALVSDLGNWIKVTDSAAWSARNSAGAFYHENSKKLYILGGQVGGGTDPNYAEVWITDANPN